MPDDDLISVHEAGHAFVAVALGLTLARVQIGDDPRYVLADELGPDRRRDRVRVLMAGGEAERVVFDIEPVGTASDDVQIASLLVDGDDESALRDSVRRLIELNAGTVRYLVARLARAGVLDGDEVERIVRGHGHSIVMRRF
jgi:hypothetical protein